MIIGKINYYDDFKCIAEKCPMSCCKGWQIVIDEEALVKYNDNSNPVFNRISNSIDNEEECFLQYDGCCAMLDEDGLCSIHKELGEEYLCKTCSQYPRHIEEFENVREYSLSLSCPEAAKIIISQKRFKIKTVETEEFEEYEDFDLFLYDQCLQVRDKIFQILEKPTMSFASKLNLVLQAGYDFQKYYDDGSFYLLQKILFYEDKDGPFFCEISNKSKFSILDDLQMYKKLKDMEMLEPDWDKYITQMGWFVDSKFGRERLEKYIKENDKKLINILRFFIFTYFCGSVYDGMIYSKCALSAYSTLWIAILTCSIKYDPKNKFENDDDILCFSAYRYAREIEHSDINVEKLEKIFMDIFDSDFS